MSSVPFHWPPTLQNIATPAKLLRCSSSLWYCHKTEGGGSLK